MGPRRAEPITTSLCKRQTPESSQTQITPESRLQMSPQSAPTLMLDTPGKKELFMPAVRAMLSSSNQPLKTESMCLHLYTLQSHTHYVTWSAPTSVCVTSFLVALTDVGQAQCGVCHELNHHSSP